MKIATNAQNCTHARLRCIKAGNCFELGSHVCTKLDTVTRDPTVDFVYLDTGKKGNTLGDSLVIPRPDLIIASTLTAPTTPYSSDLP